jgi:hypothetical protein
LINVVKQPAVEIKTGGAGGHIYIRGRNNKLWCKTLNNASDFNKKSFFFLISQKKGAIPSLNHASLAGFTID